MMYDGHDEIKTHLYLFTLAYVLPWIDMLHTMLCYTIRGTMESNLP
jgi:hypothetical protein